MSFMLLIIEPAGQRAERPREEGEACYSRMLQFSAGLRARGVLGAAQALTSDSNGARVRSRDGIESVLDGPFTESKEMVGGFFLLTCGTRAEAIAIARECPAAAWATVEVRELGPCFE